MRAPEPRVRLMPTIAALTGIIVTGGLTLWWLGGGRWTLGDAIYHALISATTVGFGELNDERNVPGARVVSALVILASLAVVAYFQSVITTWLVEDVLGHRLRFRRMQKRIDQLSGHVIVAGAGSVGRHVIEELCSTDTPLVVIDRNRHVLDDLSNELARGQLLFVVGDATHDQVLQHAGIERALGIIAALTEDKDNLYVTLTARELNPKARIVSKVVSLDAAKKILRAGADATVAPSRIGGMRMAGEMLRPTATNFLDRMLHVREHKLRIDELDLPEDSWFLGKRLRELPIRKQTGVLVLAIYSGEEVAVSPDPDTILDAGMTLVVAGELDSIHALRRLVRLTSPPAASV